MSERTPARSKESDATLRALDRLDLGATITAAAEAEGIARSTLIRALRRRGEPPRPADGRPRKRKVPLPDPFHYHDGTPLKT